MSIFIKATMSSNEDLDEEFCEFAHDSHLFSQMAAETFSVFCFHKIAYPDLQGVKGSKMVEGLMPRKFGVQR